MLNGLVQLNDRRVAQGLQKLLFVCDFLDCSLAAHLVHVDGLDGAELGRQLLQGDVHFAIGALAKLLDQVAAERRSIVCNTTVYKTGPLRFLFKRTSFKPGHQSC